MDENFAGITRQDIKNFLSRCVSCKREELPTISGPITPIIPSLMRERLIVDAIDMSRYASSNDNFKYLFTMIDSFSKFAWVYASKNKSSVTFNNILMKHFYTEGPWLILHTDNGGEFINDLVKETIKKFNATHVSGRPYHPQSQGQIERFNQTLKSRLRKSLSPVSFRYIDNLDKIVYQYNCIKHSATGFKPFILFKNIDPSNLDILQNTTHDFFDARINFLTYVEKFRNAYNDRLTNQEYVIGAKVLVAKEFNYAFGTRRGSLESFYLENEYYIQDISTNTIMVKDINNQVYNFHKLRIKIID